MLVLVTSSNNAKWTHFLAKVILFLFLSKATINFAHQSRFLRTLSWLPMFVEFCSCWMTNTQENWFKERTIYFNSVFQVSGPRHAEAVEWKRDMGCLMGDRGHGKVDRRWTRVWYKLQCHVPGDKFYVTWSHPQTLWCFHARKSGTFTQMI